MAICSPERKKRFKAYPLRQPDKVYRIDYVWDDPTEVLADPDLDDRGFPKRGNFHYVYLCEHGQGDHQKSGSISVGMELVEQVASLRVDDHKAAVAFLNEFGPWGLQMRNVTYRHSDEAYDGRYRRTDDWWAEAVRAKRAIWLHKVLRESPEEAHALAVVNYEGDHERITVDWPPQLNKERFSDRLVLSYALFEKTPSPEVMLWSYLAKMVTAGLLKSQHAEVLRFDTRSGRIIREHRAFMSVGSILWRLIADLVTELHMDKTCTFCGKPFQATRRDAQFCDSACRAANHRSVKRRPAKISDNASETTIDWRPDDSDAWESEYVGVLDKDGLGIDDIPF